MNNIVAVITVDPENRKLKSMSIKQKNFRFKCKRCATLCCKLGGPPLTRKDIKRIEREGHSAKKFFDSTNFATKFSVSSFSLKNRNDGSCIFLHQDINGTKFKCSIYDYRPTLCKLYPFSFENLDQNRIALKYIPCCMGLNNKAGDILNEEFVTNNLLDHLLESLE